MKKISTPVKKIYRMKGKSMDDVIRAFRLECASDKTKDLPYHYTTDISTLTEEQKRVNAEYDRQFDLAKNKTLKEGFLKEKFLFLIHNVIARAIASGEEWFTLNSTILEEIYGKDYRLMLRTLRRLKLIDEDQFGVADSQKVANVYRLNKELVSSTEENRGFLKKWFEKQRTVFKKHQEQAEKEVLNGLDGDRVLYERYNESLKALKMFDREGALNFIETIDFEARKEKQEIKDPVLAKLYYVDTVCRWEEEEPCIQRVDDNGRIYHLLTKTPRDLKPFLNLRFGCDAHNSHPHLFSSFLLDDYDISDSNLMRLYTAFKEIYELTEKSCDYPEPGLKDWLHRRGVCNDEVDKMPDDVLFYMYLTTVGTLWDYICSIASIRTHQEQDRNAIKTVMFAEVFYMNSLIPPEAVHKSKLEYLKLFNDLFPNVYLCIFALKSTQKEEEGDLLPCAMMKRESTIFHEILSEIYSTYPKSKVVSVHDAIYILDHKNNLNITPEDIERIMLEVYNRHNLSPSISIEYYKDKV